MRTFGTTTDNLIDEELSYGKTDYELVWYKNGSLIDINVTKVKFHFVGSKIPIGHVTKNYIEIETDYMDFYKGDAIRLDIKKGDVSLTIGTFYVDTLDKKDYTASYTAFSSLLNLSEMKLGTYNEGEYGLARMSDMVKYYFTPLGLSFNTDYFNSVDATYVIDGWESLTLQDLVECVAFSDACNFTLQGNVLNQKRINNSVKKVYRTGEIVYSNSKTKHEEDKYLDSIKINYTDYIFTNDGLQCEDATYVVAPYGIEGNQVELNFKFIPFRNHINSITQYYDDIITKGKVLLNDYTVSFMGDPRVEIGDVISFESEDGSTCTFRVGELTWEWDGGLKCTASTGPTGESISSAGGYTSIQQIADAIVSMSNSLMTVRYNAVYTNELYAKVAELGFASIEELSAEVAKLGLMTAEEADIKYLTAASADLKYANIDSLNVLQGDFESLNAKAITTDNLTAEVAKIGYLTAGEADLKYLTAASADLKYLAATSADLKYANIDLSNIKNGSITTAMIATGAINTAQIADGSITDAKIVGLTANKITAGTLDAGTIEVINLNAANITVGTINGKQIDSGAITTTHLVEGAVNGDKIAADSILAEHITAGAITTDKLVAQAVTGDKIAVQTITANNIATNTITATQIAAGAITTSELKAGAVTASKLRVTSLSAISANLGTVTAGVIKSTNYVANSAGMKLDLSNGAWTSKYFSLDTEGQVNISGGNIMLETSASSTDIYIGIKINDDIWSKMNHFGIENKCTWIRDELEERHGSYLLYDECRVNYDDSDGYSYYTTITAKKISITANSVEKISIDGDSGIVTATDIKTSAGVSLTTLNSKLVWGHRQVSFSALNTGISVPEFGTANEILIIVIPADTLYRYEFTILPKVFNTSGQLLTGYSTGNYVGCCALNYNISTRGISVANLVVGNTGYTEGTIYICYR